MFDLNNFDRRYLAVMAFILVAVFVVGVKYGDVRNARQQQEQASLEELNIDHAKAEPAPETIQVYVTGQVKYPKVCTLKPGARVFEAVEQVELLPDADIKNINMARVLQDGEPIVIPGPQEAAATVNNTLLAPSTPNAASGSGQGLVNINSATAQEMDDKLPGIGPALSQRIVDYRSAHGPFANIEDIKNVSGIGAKKFEAIKDLIVVK